jgi:hypothetical protein
MMGIIIIGLIEFVHKKKGREAVTKVLEGTGLTPSLIQEQLIYPEDAFQEVYNKAIEISEMDKDEFEKEWAKFMTNIVHNKFTGFFESSNNAQELLAKVPDIHFKVFPTIVGHQVQKINIKETGDNHIVYSYTSPNHMCIFLRTIAQEVLNAYNQEGTIEELQCQKDGAPSCDIKVTFH